MYTNSPGPSILIILEFDGGGFVGPLSMGPVLDWSGGMSVMGWGYAFAATAVVLLAGRIAFTLLRPRDLAGDRAAKR